MSVITINHDPADLVEASRRQCDIPHANALSNRLLDVLKDEEDVNVGTAAVALAAVIGTFSRGAVGDAAYVFTIALLAEQLLTHDGGLARPRMN